MIITTELPDDFNALKITIIDNNHIITKLFTKEELIDMDEYIERSKFNESDR